MAGSFWSNFGLRFNASAPSGIDELLEKGEGNFTLQEIISHDQVIQECKYMNAQLCEYLSKPHVIKQLVQYVIAPPPPAVLHPADTLDVGGSSDNDGGITTAAAMLRRKEKAKANAAAAAGDVAGSVVNSYCCAQYGWDVVRTHAIFSGHRSDSQLVGSEV